MLYLPTERWKMSHLYNYVHKFKIFCLKWPNDAVLLFSASNQSFHIDNHCINLSGAWDVVYMNAEEGTHNCSFTSTKYTSYYRKLADRG